MTIIMSKFLLLLVFISLVGCRSYPEASVGETYFEKCWHKQTGGTTIPFSGGAEDYVFRSECAPDILYSWLASDKIDITKFPTNPLRESLYLYTWRTPLSTYAYGDTQIRLKLKPDVRFKWLEKKSHQKRPRCPMKDQDKTIFVLTTTYEKVVSEYLICSSVVLESWSIQTKGAFYEAQNEYEFLKENGQKNPQLYDAFGFGFNRQKLKVTNGDSFFINWDHRVIKWSDVNLTKSLRSLKEPSHSLKGKIFYGTDTKHDPAAHFKTKIRSYFQLTHGQEKDIKKIF